MNHLYYLKKTIVFPLENQKYLPNIRMKRILVTGGCGFIGSNFIQYILKKDPSIFIINLDKLTYAGNLMNLSYTK